MPRRRFTLPASWRPWLLLWGLLPFLFWSVASPVVHTHGAAYGTATKAASCHGHPVQTADGQHHCLACDWESVSVSWQLLVVAPAVLKRPMHRPLALPVAGLASVQFAARAARGPPAA
jgi:hypothetical protein